MKHLLIVGVLALSLILLVDARRDGERGVCACPRIYSPVCGSDLNTYSNECLLKCEASTDLGKRNHLEKRSDGPCDNLADNVEEEPEEY
uniref:Putative secreted peptide n=1 Tax=Psorophora albipes TaxID=869069 RepID=T1E2S7_9DIPT